MVEKFFTNLTKRMTPYSRALNAVSVILLSVYISPANASGKLRLQSGEVTFKELGGISRQNFISNRINANRTLGVQPSTKNQKNYFILQFAEKINVENQTQLKSMGIQVLRYIPDNAYVVASDLAQMQKFVEKNKNVTSIASYLPRLKISSELNLPNFLKNSSQQLLNVRVFSGVDTGNLSENLKRIGVQVISRGRSGLTVRAPISRIQQIAEQNGVEWVGRKSLMQTFDMRLPESLKAKIKSQMALGDGDFTGDFTDLSLYESGTKVMNFTGAWAKTLLGEGQIVGVADTGLDTGDLNTLSADFSNLLSGFVWGFSSDTWHDIVGHGTHVAGSVAGTGAKSNGRIVGGAPNAQLIAQSIWSDLFGTLTTPDDLSDLFSQAYEQGARIHTNSWGSGINLGAYTEESAQVDQYMWDHPDMLILFAAGNSGVDANGDGRIDSGSVSSPSTAKNALTVGASENLVAKGGVQTELGEIEFDNGFKPWGAEPIASDTLSNNVKGIAAFSSRGPTRDGRLKPDLVAPGTNILSACSRAEGAGELWGKYNDDYCFAGGTSMATPLTAAAATLVRQRLMDVERVREPSAALVKAVLMHTAEDLYPGQFGEVGEAQGQELLKPGPNIDQGYGRVDVERAVSQKMALVDNKEGVGTNESKYYDVQLPISKVTLVYTDAPAALNSGVALVNDLDLEVHIDGEKLTSESSKDNSEQVRVESSAAAGTARIYVKGHNVPMGKNGRQPYALVVN